MSKQKILHYIETTAFDTMQKLAIFIYDITLKNKDFDFENYFNTVYEDTIKESLKFLNYKNIESYKDVFHYHLLNVYKLSKKNAELFEVLYISNRLSLFNYWKENKKIFVSEIIEIYTNE